MPEESRAARYTVLPAAASGVPVVHELEIRRSRFIGCLLRVETEEAARGFIARLRREHHDARHVCSAFILGPDRDVMRSSDDGEPAGTAGIPMLEALALRETGDGSPSGAGTGPRRDLSDVCAVVVRYFGGVKLGAGGLVRAYSEAVSAALDTTATVTRQRMELVGIEAPHAQAGRWENDLRAAGFTVRGTAYGTAAATVTLALPDDGRSRDALASRLAAVTAGDGAVTTLGTEWVDRP